MSGRIDELNLKKSHAERSGGNERSHLLDATRCGRYKESLSTDGSNRPRALPLAIDRTMIDRSMDRSFGDTTYHYDKHGVRSLQ